MKQKKYRIHRYAPEVSLKEALRICDEHIAKIMAMDNTTERFDYTDVKSRMLAHWRKKRDEISMNIGK